MRAVCGVYGVCGQCVGGALGSVWGVGAREISFSPVSNINSDPPEC